MIAEPLVLFYCFITVVYNFNVTNIYCFNLQGLTRVKDTLTSLELQNCMTTYCYDIHQIANIVPKLKHLNVSDIYPFSSMCPLEALGRFTELQSLDLSDNCLVNDNIIRIIVNSCSELRILNLNGMYFI